MHLIFRHNKTCNPPDGRNGSGLCLSATTTYNYCNMVILVGKVESMRDRRVIFIMKEYRVQATRIVQYLKILFLFHLSLTIYINWNPFFILQTHIYRPPSSPLNLPSGATWLIPLGLLDGFDRCALKSTNVAVPKSSFGLPRKQRVLKAFKASSSIYVPMWRPC